MSASSIDATPRSTRVELAAIAATSAAATNGVAALDAGAPPVFVTGTGDQQIVGVSVVAADAYRYTVDVSIVATVTPLHALAARLRLTVAERARRAGLAEALGDVRVHIQDVVANPGAA